jgi:CheY-like chemotaxis protein
MRNAVRRIKLALQEADRKPKILIVEDNLDAVEPIAVCLEDEGYDVLRAANGLEALQCMEREPHMDLIILDLNMPKMDGAAFLRAMRRDARFRLVPVIVTSANAASLRDPVEAIFTKPFDLDALMAEVSKLLSTADGAG